MVGEFTSAKKCWDRRPRERAGSRMSCDESMDVSPFRRVTTAHREVASHFDASVAERAWTAPSLARTECETQT
jgi:hypothetical protein